MKNTRRKHSDAFKTEVALEAIRERKTLSELAQEYQLAPAQISTWKAEFLSNAQMAFCSTPQFSDHWLSLFPLTLSVPYENKKVERESLAELSTRFNLHPNMITTWKRDFIERSSAIFETDRPVSNFDDERERLFAKIGRLEMELDWLKKISVRAGLSVKEWA